MHVKTLILGAGAAGLHCAAFSGPDTLVVDHAKAPGEKIRISGGGRCNFTNTGTTSANFISQNPHFAKSALARYTQWDFIDLVDRHGIAWHEKTLGQLFCDDTAKDIIAMLLAEMAPTAQLWLQTTVGNIAHDGTQFRVAIKRGGKAQIVTADALVVATGGKSIPKMGATGLAYDIARQFDLNVTDTRAALVPFTFSDEKFKPLAGVAAPPVQVTTADGTSFDEAMLFTHRGLSGPAVLQASSYWHSGEDITVALAPTLANALRDHRNTDGRKALTTVLAGHLPARLVDFLAGDMDLSGNVADLSDKGIDALSDALNAWQLRPSGTEGYRTAEVTAGGVDTNDLSSKTMEAKTVPGLYFIGEAVDVTGWLGGYNFQWAWSSAYAAGTAIAAHHS